MSANIIIEHNETGLVKSEVWCQDGKQYRVEKEYYCNGQLSQESHYRNEVKT
jgi:antitoxin component YwqK of YwqJK toxin-antitoxin module